MKKTSKVVTVLGAGIAVVVGAHAVEYFVQIENEKAKEKMKENSIDAANEAFYRFSRLNLLGCDVFKKVTELGITPVYNYDSRKLKMEEMKIPEGYAMLKSRQPNGKQEYALAKMSYDEVFSDYRIYAYFVDGEEAD